jgi:hypothetical protein
VARKEPSGSRAKSALEDVLVEVHEGGGKVSMETRFVAAWIQYHLAAVGLAELD